MGYPCCGAPWNRERAASGPPSGPDVPGGDVASEVKDWSKFDIAVVSGQNMPSVRAVQERREQLGRKKNT